MTVLLGRPPGPRGPTGPLLGPGRTLTENTVTTDSDPPRRRLGPSDPGPGTRPEAGPDLGEGQGGVRATVTVEEEEHEVEWAKSRSLRLSERLSERGFQVWTGRLAVASFKFNSVT